MIGKEKNWIECLLNFENFPIKLLHNLSKSSALLPQDFGTPSKGPPCTPKISQLGAKGVETMKILDISIPEIFRYNTVVPPDQLLATYYHFLRKSL